MPHNIRMTCLGKLSLMLTLLVAAAGVSAQTNGANGAALYKCSVRPMTTVPAMGVLASDGDRVYVGTLNGTIMALEATTLEVAWRAELGGEFASDVLVLEIGIAVVTNSALTDANPQSSTLRLISKETGITGWSLKLPSAERFYLGKINGSIATIGREGSITLADRATGQIRWQTGSFGKLSTKPAFSEESVVFGTSDKVLFVISAKDGSIVSRQSAEMTPTSVTFSKDAGFTAGDERGNVSLFGSSNTKTVWRFKSGAAVTSVTATDEGILVSSLDNFVYFISDYNGDVIWKRRLSGRVIDGGLIVGGYLVVLIYGENSTYVVDVKTGKVGDAMPASDRDFVSRVPVFVRDKRFAIATTDSVEVYALGGCDTK